MPYSTGVTWRYKQFETNRFNRKNIHVPPRTALLHHFHMFVFLGVHFNAFGVLERVMNAVRVCITETQSLSCVLFTFCIMSLNFHWSKKWYELFTSCNVFCMQARHFRNFQIRASLCYTCTLQGRIHHCQNVHHKQPQQVVEFSRNLFALYLLWDNFLISEMTWIHVNNTTKKTPCQPQTVHSHLMLIAENVTLPHWRVQALNAVQIKSALFWDVTQRRLVVSCWRFGTKLGGCEILTAVLVKIQISGTFRPVDWLIYRHLQGQQSKMKALRSIETSVTLHESTPVWERPVSQNRRPCWAELLCVTRLFMDLWRSLPHSQKPHTGRIFHSVLYDILKLCLTPISAEFYSLHSFYYM